MSRHVPDGGPAFPLSNGYSLGMSLRDWFAGQALAGLMASPEGRRRADEWVRDAFAIADLMITEREIRGRRPLPASSPMEGAR